MTIATILGHAVTLADVYAFVVNWLVPVGIGVLTSLSVDWAKVKQYVPHALRPYLMRALVAAVCVVANAAARLVAGEGIDPAVLGQTFLSYVSAVALFEHKRN